MPARSVADTLAELQRCPLPRRLGKPTANAVEPLVRLMEGCEVHAVEELPGAIVFRLQTMGGREARVTCVVHFASPAPLTPAEAEVAEQVCAGRTRAQIAHLRGVSLNTIKSQVRQIFRKLEVDSRVALVRRLAP